MSKENGFLQLRRGVFEHVKDGRMSHMDALAFIYIVAQADTRTGIWNGSASSLAGELGMSPRTARDVLERLSARGYLRRFPVPGKHSCYPILVHKFLITGGEHYDEHLNARESTSKDDLRYFPREQRVEDYGGHGVEHGAAQRRSENGDKRLEKKKEARAAPSLSFSGQHLRVTEKQDTLLGEAFPWVDRPAEYRKADSWLEANPEKRPRKYSRFLHNWFTRISQPKGGTNGRDINEAVATTMRGFAVNAGITH